MNWPRLQTKQGRVYHLTCPSSTSSSTAVSSRDIWNPADNAGGHPIIQIPVAYRDRAMGFASSIQQFTQWLPTCDRTMLDCSPLSSTPLTRWSPLSRARRYRGLPGLFSFPGIASSCPGTLVAPPLLVPASLSPRMVGWLGSPLQTAASSTWDESLESRRADPPTICVCDYVTAPPVHTALPCGLAVWWKFWGLGHTMGRSPQNTRPTSANISFFVFNLDRPCPLVSSPEAWMPFPSRLGTHQGKQTQYLSSAGTGSSQPSTHRTDWY
jgi:hypothetical protein